VLLPLSQFGKPSPQAYAQRSLGSFLEACAKGAFFFVDDLHNITSISKADLALIIRDQFQSFGIELLNYSICFSAKSDYFAEPKALAEPAVRFYTKVYLQPFTPEEVVEYTRSVFDVSLDTAATVAAWLHEKTLGHRYFLAFVCKQLSVMTSEIRAEKLEPCWPAVFDQLGGEKFSLDVSQLSAMERELIHQIARLRDNEPAPHHFTARLQWEYFVRLVKKGLLICTERGRYKLYHPLFREFLQQTQ
jgi:hypothetical protein